MSKRLTATILGIGASLCGVLIWILLSFVGFIAGIAGALMGIAFIFVYKRINKEDESNYPNIVAGIIIAIDIVIAELITIVILASPYNVSLTEALKIPEISRAVIIDIILGLALSFLCYISYVFSQKRKKKNEQTMAEYNQSLNQIVKEQQTAAGSKENIQAASTTREITIVREKRFVASLVKISFICDGAIVGTAKNGETLTFKVDGRQHSLCATMGTVQSQLIMIEADGENKAYKIKIKSGMSTNLLLEKC